MMTMMVVVQQRTQRDERYQGRDDVVIVTRAGRSGADRGYCEHAGERGKLDTFSHSNCHVTLP